MKKYLLFAMIAFMGIVLTSCENGSSQGKNPYPYLRLSDIAPLHLTPLSKAEAKLAEMGFKDGEVDGKYYVYFSQDKLEYVECILNTDGLVASVVYISEKDVAPTDAKEWLVHIPENVKLPNYSKYIPFNSGFVYVHTTSKSMEVTTYADYLAQIKDMTIGMHLEGLWQADDCDYRVDIVYDGGQKKSAGIYIIPKDEYLTNQ